jgi:phage gp29-like protein
MAERYQLVDQYERPVRRELLTQEIAKAEFGTIRSPVSGYPADGLDPVRLATILRQADQGDPVSYLELAEILEERDPHYLAVLGTRKRSVSQLEVSVETKGTSAQEKKHADALRDWLTRDELQTELFDMLDAVGKGYSFTEIIWEHTDGMTVPARLEWRDPRWFRFKREDLRTPVMLSDGGQEEDLPAFKFVYTTMKAKSGLPLRSGLARVAAWTWMFKAFTQRDWAIFTQTYGQPIRVGKYNSSASEAEKDTLFGAVANIAGDCAAIIPEGMTIEFIEAKSASASNDLYKERAVWLDEQTSKAVLGQTSTTDAKTGGLGSGKEHREVQEDIERADAVQLRGHINQQLVRAFIGLNYGPQKIYPRLMIGRPEEEDLVAWTEGITPWTDRGLEVPEQEVRTKFGVAAPQNGEKTLGGKPDPAADPQVQSSAGGVVPPEGGFKGGLKGGKPVLEGEAALQAEEPASGAALEAVPSGFLSARLEAEALPAMDSVLTQIEGMLEASSDLEEFREHLLSAFPELNAGQLTEVMAQAITAGFAGGMSVVEEEAGG